MPDVALDVLEQLLVRVDLDRACFTADEVARLPQDAWASLLAAGLVRPAENAVAADCEWCAPSHSEDVEYLSDPPGTPPRPHVYCPENGWVEIEPERLRRWAPDLTRLAEGAAAACGCARSVEELVPGRVWFLGRTTVGDETRDVFFARKLAWPLDGPAVVEGCPRFRMAVAPVVLVAGAVVPPEVWSKRPPMVLALPTFVTFDGERLVADRAYLEGACGVAQPPKPALPPAPFATPRGASWGDVAIRFLDGHSVSVRVGASRGVFTYAEMGMGKRTNAMPDMQWLLLQAMSKERGALTWKNAHRDRKNKKRRSRLSERLVSFFGIEDGDPIEYAKELKGWRTRFELHPADESVGALPT